tara:strand:+ start:3011 stop:3553 length:543 start_codon:yes stop_codon:yes gene_type:complete
MTQEEKLNNIRDYVSEWFNIDLTDKSKTREYSEARAFYYKIAREFTKCGLAMIAESVGKTHASVIHSMKNTLPHLDQTIVSTIHHHYSNDYKIANPLVNSTLKEANTDLMKDNLELRTEVESLRLLVGKLPMLGDLVDSLDALPDAKIPVAKDRIKAMLGMLRIEKIWKPLNREMDGALK